MSNNNNNNRTCPCLWNHALDEFGSCQRGALCALANCELTDSAWFQATIPVGRGRLGLVGVAALAPSAFLASAMATASLQSSLLSSSNAREDALVAEALAFWMAFGPRVAPVAPLDARQSGWHAAWLGKPLEAFPPSSPPIHTNLPGGWLVRHLTRGTGCMPYLSPRLVCGLTMRPSIWRWVSVLEQVCVLHITAIAASLWMQEAHMACRVAATRVESPGMQL